MQRSRELDISALPVLNEKQVGNLRHIENLARQPKGDWSHMSGRHPFQEDFGSYRFQIAYMAYALGLTHFHRLPAAPGAFRDTFDLLIQKMLHPEVWLYWRDASQGGAPGFNAHLRGKLPQRVDPVAKDNIMYSAYVQSMALMYNVLFDDDKYAQPGALTMRLDPFFWTLDETEFVYDQNSLNENLYWQMVESGYLGIACEPNCVFQICNQPAILGFRLHDLRKGAHPLMRVRLQNGRPGSPHLSSFACERAFGADLIKTTLRGRKVSCLGKCPLSCCLFGSIDIDQEPAISLPIPEPAGAENRMGFWPPDRPERAAGVLRRWVDQGRPEND
jgi:Linalool dehydratase/isomerase